MPDDEKIKNFDSESDSESDEEENADHIPKIVVDPSTLTPLSPEVISKQVRYKLWGFSFSGVELCLFVGDNKLGYKKKRLIVTDLTFFSICRYHWTCRAWKINGCESNIWGYDCQIQERASKEYYN